LAALGAADEQEIGADQFLELLRQKARRGNGAAEEEAAALAQSIRRELLEEGA
jgi:hypothetical protein